MVLLKERRLILMLLCGLFIVSMIAVIEAKSNEELYQEKLIKIKDDDVKGHYELANSGDAPLHPDRHRGKEAGRHT